MISYKNKFKYEKNLNKVFFDYKKYGSSKTITLFQGRFFYCCSRYFTNYVIKKKPPSYLQYNLKKERGVAQQAISPGLAMINKPNKKREKKRSSLILPQHIGRIFFVHNGKSFSSIHVYRKMLGHKFGEFASTRKKPVHKKKR